MNKILLGFTAILLSTFSIAQDNSFDNQIEQHGNNNQMANQTNTEIGGDEWNQTFNNLNHPLAITGGILTLAGAGTYIAGSKNSNYQPRNNTQYVGIGLFAAGAALFVIFSTERDENTPKRKKKKNYNSGDWEVPQ
jgi:hypothetical protein